MILFFLLLAEWIEQLLVIQRSVFELLNFGTLVFKMAYFIQGVGLAIGIRLIA